MLKKSLTEKNNHNSGKKDDKNGVTFFFDTCQPVDEMTEFQLSSRQVPDNWKEMVVHTGKQTGGVVL
ncbi:hypothetical protein Dd703_1436 [Musicola paradisiaca Ech703]|uniref:Uncharacterized protein n=1 Tax=Musicola paradisiaca (strain Ech703) TaxID=579405 RepID=C6C2X3_MUSP7|nr:hypothetical protein Dd703_1436 [Musicola paradisiaca Ech703]